MMHLRGICMGEFSTLNRIKNKLWMPDEVIGKLIRRKLEQAEGADITVTYTVIIDEIQQAAHNF